MVDMRLSDEEKKDFSTPSLGPKAPRFPHGLVLRFGPEEAQKLGFSDPPGLDDKCIISGKGFVSEVRKAESDGDEKEFTFEIQMTEIEIKKEGDSGTTEEALYQG